MNGEPSTEDIATKIEEVFRKMQKKRRFS